MIPCIESTTSRAVERDVTSRTVAVVGAAFTLLAIAGCGGPSSAPAPQIGPSHDVPPSSPAPARSGTSNSLPPSPANASGFGVAAEIAIGEAHCVRNTAGEVYCWGDGDYGSLGDGLRHFSPVPKRIPLPRPAKRLAHGLPICAVLDDGHVACWGGWSPSCNGGTAFSLRVIDGLTDIVSAGVFNGSTIDRFFVRSDGTVFHLARAPQVRGGRCEMPQTVSPVPALQGAVDISGASSFGLCAQLRDGTLRCVSDFEGTRPAPSPPIRGVAQLADGCAIAADRSLSCWGTNDHGQVGDGSTLVRESPVLVRGAPNTVHVSVGPYSSCAVAADGTVRCWGDTSELPILPGQPTRIHPSPVVVPLQDVVSVEVGSYDACAVTRAGGVACWGKKNGLPTFVPGFGAPSANAAAPAIPAPTSTSALPTTIAAGGNMTCARMADASVRCWGENDKSQLGDGTSIDRSTPTPSPYLHGVRSVHPGDGHACALMEDATVQCWGQVVGSGAVPAPVPGLTHIKQVSASRMTCVLGEDGRVRCWGDRDEGENMGSTEPTFVAGAVDIDELSVGGGGRCGRTRSSNVLCWGANSIYALAGGRPRTRTAVAAGVKHARGLAGFETHCAVRDDGNVTCWGYEEVADLHDPTGKWAPVRALNYAHAKSIVVGQDASCAILVDGTVSCFAKTVSRTMSTLSNIVELAAGRNHFCARDAAGAVSCWGDNAYGQLGDGTTTSHDQPVRVTF